MVMNESAGILKSASSGNQGQMVIFYESSRIIKPNEWDYFGKHEGGCGCVKMKMSVSRKSAR